MRQIFLLNLRGINIHEDDRSNGKIIKEHYKYENILTPIEFIFGLVHDVCHWFKERINTITLKAGFNKFKTDPCRLNILNELGTDIFNVYVDEIL